MSFHKPLELKENVKYILMYDIGKGVLHTMSEYEFNTYEEAVDQAQRYCKDHTTNWYIFKAMARISRELPPVKVRML